jgi:hypothetical protein
MGPRKACIKSSFQTDAAAMPVYEVKNHQVVILKNVLSFNYTIGLYYLN